MKTLLYILFVLFVMNIVPVYSQSTRIVGLPYKSTESDAYGTDILIQDNAGEDQRSAKIVVAPNGYLYSAYLISSGGLRVAKSTNNGITWSYSSLLRAAYYITSLDLAVTGTDSTNINIWVASTGFFKASIDVWDVNVEKLDQQMSMLSSTGLDQMISNFGFPDVAIATDFEYPSVGTSPFSIGILYSKIGLGSDEVIFKSSADGGATFSNTQSVASGGHYFVNVALAFGRSASLPEGRYFASWDKQPAFSYYGSYYGKIFTAYTLTQFNGTWSTPIEVDGIGGGFTNGAKDPSIACQADQMNNGSNAFSVIIAFDKITTASGSNTSVCAVGNLNPIGGGSWLPVFSSGTGSIYDFESDVTYDPLHQKFYITYSDSLNAKLKCSSSSMNLPGTGGWTVFSSGYNDIANIMNPYPRVKMNTVTNQVVNVWNGQRSSMIANSTFDVSDLPVSISNSLAPEAVSFSVFPNPCRDKATLTFSLDKEEAVSLTVFSLTGQIVKESQSQTFPSGNNHFMLNTDQLKPGYYLVKLSIGSYVNTKRLIVNP